jgi:hypothetical protein
MGVLTAQDCGYFTSSSPPVGRLPEPIDFRKLVNQAEYRLVLDRLHSQLGVSLLLSAARAALRTLAGWSAANPTCIHLTPPHYM